MSCLCHDWASCEILSNPINTLNPICTVTCLIFVRARRHQSSPTTSTLKHTMRITNTLIWFLMMLYTVCQNTRCPQAIVSRQPQCQTSSSYEWLHTVNSINLSLCEQYMWWETREATKTACDRRGPMAKRSVPTQSETTANGLSCECDTRRSVTIPFNLIRNMWCQWCLACARMLDKLGLLGLSEDAYVCVIFACVCKIWVCRLWKMQCES